MSKFRIKSKSRVNLSDDKFYKMISISYINCKIELIEHFPRNNADELICKKNEVIYVSAYVCMYVCVHVCMYVCMHACMHIRIIFACMYVHIHVRNIIYHTGKGGGTAAVALRLVRMSLM